MRKKNKIRFINVFILIAIIEIVGVVGFLGFNMFTLTKDIKKLNSETLILHQKIDSANTVESLKTDLSKTNASINDIEAMFFDDKSLLNFLKGLSSDALKFGIDINTISFGNLTTVQDTAPPLKALPISLNISSGYDNLANFLKSLETYNHYIVENSVSYSATGIANTGINITFYIRTASVERWSYEDGNP